MEQMPGTAGTPVRTFREMLEAYKEKTREENRLRSLPIIHSLRVFRYRLQLDTSAIETPEFTVDGRNCTREEFLREFDEFRKAEYIKWRGI